MDVDLWNILRIVGQVYSQLIEPSVPSSGISNVLDLKSQSRHGNSCADINSRLHRSKDLTPPAPPRNCLQYLQRWISRSTIAVDKKKKYPYQNVLSFPQIGTTHFVKMPIRQNLQITIITVFNLLALTAMQYR